MMDRGRAVGGPRDALLRGPERVVPNPPLPLELGPALHGDLAAVELAHVLDTGLLRLLAGGLPRLAPREVVELPEGVGGQDKVPDRERKQVDEHP